MLSRLTGAAVGLAAAPLCRKEACKGPRPCNQTTPSAPGRQHHPAISYTSLSSSHPTRSNALITHCFHPSASLYSFFYLSSSIHRPSISRPELIITLSVCCISSNRACKTASNGRANGARRLLLPVNCYLYYTWLIGSQYLEFNTLHSQDAIHQASCRCCGFCSCQRSDREVHQHQLRRHHRWNSI